MLAELEDMYKVGRQAFQREIKSVKYTETNVPMYCSDIAIRAELNTQCAYKICACIMYIYIYEG